MAVTTQFGVPTDNGTATLMPKLQYRFRVRFIGMGQDGQNESSQNVISVGRPSITHEEVIIDSGAAKGVSSPVIVHSKNKTKTDKTSAA